MKKLLTLLALSFGLSAIAQTNVGINTTTPNASAALDVTSTTQGLLPPRMTMAQRNAIASPVDGLVVYQTDNTPGLYLRNNGTWGPVGGGGSTITGPTTELFATSNTVQTRQPYAYTRYSFFFNNIVTQLNPMAYNSSANSYTVPAGKGGTYQLNVNLLVTSHGFASSFIVAPEIQVTNSSGTIIYYGVGSGSPFFQGTDTDSPNPFAGSTGAPFSLVRGSCVATVPLQAGDILKVYYRASSNSGSSSQNVTFSTDGSSYFSIVKLN